MREKRNKGYMPIEQKKFDQLSIQAAIVGTANKCSEFKWVEVTDEGRKFHQVSEDRLANPECNPGLYMEIETKKEYGNKHKFNLLFTFTQAFEVTQKLHGINSTYICEPVTKDSPIHELTTKAEEALGRSFST
jgi:hypothetical protein